MPRVGSDVSVSGSHHVNGVAAVHTECVKRGTFMNLCKWSVASGEPDKFGYCTSWCMAHALAG